MTYRTIVLDPPWEYAQAGPRGAAARIYQTMSNAAIAELPVGQLADENAHLFLWVTNPRLFGEPGEIGPIDMLRGWGFRHVGMLTWHKLGSPGVGWYFRGDTEHVLFGVRGTAPIAAAQRLSTFFAAPRTGHSAKPDRFYEIVEQVSPAPWLEMFARRRRVGWDVWGNEAPPESEARSQVPMFSETAA